MLAHACALHDEGVTCWGINPAPETTDIPILQNPTDVSTGRGSSCVIDDGEIRCWGGLDMIKNNIPVVSNPTQISLGMSHACVLEDKGVSCWGSNYLGSTDVPSLNNPSFIDAGTGMSCAIDGNDVVCWGMKNDRKAFSNPVLVSVSDHHPLGNWFCVLDDNGVSCWGWHFETGNLFEIETPELDSPVQISLGPDFECALHKLGVECWKPSITSPINLSVPTLISPTQISSGLSYACAIEESGLICWGRGVAENSDWDDIRYYADDYELFKKAVNVPPLSSPHKISIGFHGCALDDKGVKCWGAGSDLPGYVKWDYSQGY